MTIKQNKNETQVHHQAFEFYYQLGHGRKLPRVAQEFGVAVSTVKRWSRSFDWAARIKARDSKIASQVAEKAEQEAVDVATSMLKSIEIYAAEFHKRLLAGQVKVTSVPDFVKMVQAYMDLTRAGERTDDDDQVDNLSGLLEAIKEAAGIEDPDKEKDKNEGQEPILN